MQQHTTNVEDIKEGQWKAICRSLREGRCIPVLGYNLLTDQQGASLLEGFAERLAQDLSPEQYDARESRNMGYMAMRWLAGVEGVVKEDLWAEFAAFLAMHSDRIPDIYRALADLPFRFVLNASPDDYAYQSFLLGGGARGSGVVFEHYNYQQNQATTIHDLTDKIFIYNMFGYYGQPDSLVVSQEDRLNYIEHLISQRVAQIPPLIYNQLTADKYYLFLGFDARDWHLPILFRRLMYREEQPYRQNHYIDSLGAGEAIIDFYKSALAFNFVGGDALQFVQALKEHYADYQAQQQEPPFIRHVHLSKRPDARVILVMTAAPKNGEELELLEEYNEIEQALEAAPAERQTTFVLRPVLNISSKKLLDKFLRHQPSVVHFSGHGARSGLLLYGAGGYAELASSAHFSALLGQFPHIECLVLNACYSAATAQDAATAGVPYVIAWEGALEDTAACAFSEAFYTALFGGADYLAAFRLATIQLRLASYKGDYPLLWAGGKKWEEA